MHGVQDFLEAFESAYAVECEVLRLGEFVLGSEAFKEGSGVPIDVFHYGRNGSDGSFENYAFRREW